MTTISQREVTSILRGSELFGSLSYEELGLIAPLCSLRTYREGEEILRQGEQVSSLFIVVRGNVALKRRLAHPHSKTNEVILSVLSPRHLVGWSAVVEPCVATLSAEPVKECDLLVVDGQALRALLEKHLSVNQVLMKRLVTLLADRLKKAYDVLDTYL